MLSFPDIVFALAVVAILGANTQNVIFAVGIVAIPVFARTARAVTLSVLAEPYIEGSVALGASPARVILRHVLPNILMICCVYAVTALLFKNPLPAVPALVLYIIYSNMLTWDSKGQCHARPFSIMVRFPGNFFETELPHQVYLNQLLLVAASILLMFIAVWMWKRRRVH